MTSETIQMIRNHTYPGICRPEPMNRPAIRLLRDETGVTTLEYVVAGVALALAGVAASRVISGVLVNYLHHVYLVVTLPMP